MLPDNLYKEILNDMPIATVDVVIFDEFKNTLLFRRKNNPAKGFYYTIGGRLLKGENPLEAAFRICKSEAGLNVVKSKLKFKGFINEIFEDSMYPGVKSHCVNIFYALNLNNKNRVKMDDQHSDFTWVKIDDLENAKVHLYAITKIKACLN